MHCRDLIGLEASPKPPSVPAATSIAGVMRGGGRMAAEGSRQLAAKGRAAAGRLLVAPDRGREEAVLAEAFRRAGPGKISQRQLANIAKTIDAVVGTPATGRLNFSALVDAHPELVAVRGEGGSRILAWREQQSGQDGRALVEALASRLAASGRSSLAVASLKSWALEATGRSFAEAAYGCASMVEFLGRYPDIFAIGPSVGPAGALAMLVQAPPVVGMAIVEPTVAIGPAADPQDEAEEGPASWPQPAVASRITVPMPPPIIDSSGADHADLSRGDTSATDASTWPSLLTVD